MMLRPEDEETMLRAVVALRDAERTLKAVDKRRYAGKPSVKEKVESIQFAVRDARVDTELLVRESRAERKAEG